MICKMNSTPAKNTSGVKGLGRGVGKGCMTGFFFLFLVCAAKAKSSASLGLSQLPEIYGKSCQYVCVCVCVCVAVRV